MTLEPGVNMQGKVGFQAFIAAEKDKIVYGSRETAWSFAAETADGAFEGRWLSLTVTLGVISTVLAF